MKATLADKPPRGDDWLFEVKWDGVRAIAFVEHEDVRLQSRSGHRCERQYPELAVIHHHIAAESAILDGEIAVLDEKGVSQFHLIQPRIANTDPNSVAHLVRSTPVVYFVFDLLYLDGYDLRQVDLGKRRELLEALVTPGPVVRRIRGVPRSRHGDARRRAPNRARRDHREACVELLRIAAQPGMAQNQDRQPAGVRHRRLHRTAGRSRLLRRAGARALRGREAELGRQRGHGIRPEDADQP